MVNWMQWLAALLAAIGSFLGTHPFPHQQRVAARLARRGYVVQYQPAAPTAPASEKVVDTRMQTEGARAVTYQWVERSTQPGVLFLYREGMQVGGWYVAGRVYLGYDAGTNAWATICNGQTCVPAYKDCPPVPLPNEAKPAIPSVGQAPGEPKTGVDSEKLKDYGKGNTRKGKNITREEAFEALSKTIPDDSSYLRICCIGSCNADKLKSDLAGPLAGEKVTVQSYASNEEPILKDLGFCKSGVHILSPSGMPLYWCASYGDPEGMKKGIEVAQAREKDPRWDPAKWPNLEQLQPAAPPAPVPAPTPSPAPAPAPVPAPPDPAPAPAPDGGINWQKVICGLLFSLLGLLLHNKYPVLNILFAKLFMSKSKISDEDLAALLQQLKDAKAQVKPPSA